MVLSNFLNITAIYISIMIDPLACAARNKHDDAILLLLEHGALIRDIVIYDTTTHLLLYIESGGSSEKVIAALQQHGSDAFKSGVSQNGSYRDYECPIMCAILTDKISTIPIMLNYQTIRADPDDISQYINAALDKGYIDTCKALILLPEFDPNIKYAYNKDTILHTIIRKKNYELATFILTNSSICVNAGTYNGAGQTLIYKSIVYKMYDVLKLLLERDPDITKKALTKTMIQIAKEPCLHLAARKGDIKALELMYPYVTDINLLSYDTSLTALDIANQYKKTMTSKWLIDHGAVCSSDPLRDKN
jgi:hypothetical protein